MKTFTEFEIEELEMSLNLSLSAIQNMLAAYKDAKEHFKSISDYMPESVELKFSNMNIVKEDFRKTVWNSLLWKTGILDITTKQRKSELEAALTISKKDFTAENITEFLNSLKENEGKYIAESREFITRYKRGNKINIPNFIENIGTNYERGKIVSLLINLTYHYMGKPINISFNNEIAEAIKAARMGYTMQAGNAETENFKLEWFANGNLHITFKDAAIFKKITE